LSRASHPYASNCPSQDKIILSTSTSRLRACSVRVGVYVHNDDEQQLQAAQGENQKEVISGVLSGLIIFAISPDLQFTLLAILDYGHGTTAGGSDVRVGDISVVHPAQAKIVA
jgi:hypothetical protein